MPKGYWIAHVDVFNDEGYKEYVKLNGQPFAEFGAKFLVRGGSFESMEGKSRPRNVVLEFPSYQAALDCYNSENYQKALAVRRHHSEGDLIIIEGYDGPQPA